MCQEGVYQRRGDPERAARLLEEFTRDARNVKLRENERRLEDVTDTLKDFLSQVEDALLAKELYPYWVSALGTKTSESQVLAAGVRGFLGRKDFCGRRRREGREAEGEEVLHLHPEFTQDQQVHAGGSAAAPVQVCGHAGS